jgi:hypothetical protein
MFFKMMPPLLLGGLQPVCVETSLMVPIGNIKMRSEYGRNVNFTFRCRKPKNSCNHKKVTTVFALFNLRSNCPADSPPLAEEEKNR